MPVVKTNRGHQQVHISNLSEATIHVDGLETLQTAANVQLTSIDDRLEDCIGHTNNTTAIGDGSNQLRSLMLGYDRSNGKARSLLVDSGGKLECSVSDLEVTMQNVNLNTDTLEAKIQSIDTRLDNSIGAVSSTISGLGDGSSQLRSVGLGYDRTNGKAVSFLVDAAGHQQVDIVSMPTASGAATEAKQDVIEASLTSMEGKMDAANTDLAALEVLQTSTNSLLTTLDGVQDNALTKLGEIDTAIDTIDSVLDASLVKQTNLETLLTAANVDHAANEVLLTSVDQKLGDIETAVQGTITVDGTVTANLSATDNAVLDAMVVDLAALEILQTSTNSLLTGIDADTNAIKVDAAAIEVLLTGIDSDTNDIKTDMAAIEVLLTAANVDHAANEVLLTGIDADTNAMKVDLAALEVLQTSTNSLLTTLDGVQDNILTKLTGIDEDTDAIRVDAAAIEVLLTDIDADTNAIKVDMAAIEVLNTSILAKLTPVKTVSVLFNNVTIADGGNSTSSAVDITLAKHVDFGGMDTGSSGTVELSASDSSSGTYFTVDTGSFGSGRLSLAGLKNTAYKFIKLKINNTGGSSSDYTASAFIST